MINRTLNYFGYYQLDQLQTWGHCGCCGKAIREVLLKDWSWGLCETCKGVKL